MQTVAGIDLGGTAINYTLVNGEEQFLIEGLCEHPALAKQGPEICLQQIADGLKVAVEKAGVPLAGVVAAGLDTPGPANADGVLSRRGSTNFVHKDWAGFDIRLGLEEAGHSGDLLERRQCRRALGPLHHLRRGPAQDLAHSDHRDRPWRRRHHRG